MQRNQGRDLFDLWWALTAPTPEAAHRLDPQRAVAAFADYMQREGSVITFAEYAEELAKKGKGRSFAPTWTPCSEWVRIPTKRMLPPMSLPSDCSRFLIRNRKFSFLHCLSTMKNVGRTTTWLGIGGVCWRLLPNAAKIADLPELAEALNDHRFTEYFEKLETAYRKLWDRLGEWDERAEFDPIADIAVDVLERGGMKLIKTSPDNTKIEIPFRAWNPR
ncbi:hypothetical protein [Mesorhizobium sp. M1A.F.Ca.ET.072.01.1.1]|uniref:hypothetical protein n=1 Tax=Mesorhizobium sp. M1A.F.Ca.ET.072.01.1.1 TaxID=2496753 RepID=UPI001FE22B11|nr:hypothetical protein [Mesorhizobium sp. M1A.F.Ca.ET.072.01.1.1]